MVLKKTSVNGLVFPHSSSPPGVYLADFDIDGYDLKPHHKQWLRENVIDRVKAKHTSPGAGGLI